MNLQTCRRPQRWATWAAVTIPFTVLPSTVWRLAFGAGVPVGFHGELARQLAVPGWITVYVAGLGVLGEGVALLALGLVRPWGEVVPGWVPRIGGRRIPVAAAAVPAALGAVALILVTTMSVAVWNGPENNGDPDAPHGVAGVVMAVAYAPLLAWGPLLLLVTAAYVHRRVRPAGPEHRQRGTSPLS